MLDVFFENRFNARYIMLILLVVILLFAVIARYHGMGVVNQQEEQLPDFVMNKVLEEGVTKGAGTGIDSMILKWALAAAEHPDESDAHRFDSFEGALFVGDSRTEGMKFYSGVDNADFFSGKSMNVSKVLKGETVNVGGQELSLQDLLKKKTYNKVYISLGLNELGWTSKDSFVESYGTLIDQVKEAQPDAEVFVQLLFPVSSKKSASDKVFNNANIKACNDRLTKLAEDKDVKVLDPSPPLVDTTGALKMEATSDGVHINSDYCVKWAVYLARISM
jgi:lysophospholipase L1-like esterase